MPFIQCDIEQGLSNEQKTEIVRRMIEVTNKAIGSSCDHINVVLREHPTANIGETGKTNLGLISRQHQAA
ncbi:tautomerase family protein [Mesorhizobium sp. DCY119]|uniref:tautomerase family protein n=1 Tax=Mesorhizobium sp. DCY119 TaxID=2108445 RepID=UPI0013C436E4|nr:tautomerase family protein [Mesorhizobium sp. DCY119]